MMEMSENKDLEAQEAGPTDKEIQVVKDVIASFLIAMKNYALYPENHAICQKSINNATGRLDGFLNDHDVLGFDVEKDRLVFGGKVVYKEVPGEENLAFPLFRDGVKSLEFEKGIELGEISGLLKILNEYKDPLEEAEGDLVTALWEKDFPHLRYKAVDLTWETEPLVDLSLLKVAPDEHHSVAQHEAGDNIQEEGYSIPEDIPLPMKDRSLWQLTPEEIRKLSAMIVEEEKRDSTEEVVDIVLFILDDQRGPQDFAAALEFLEDEFQDTLAQGEFLFAFKLLSGLHGIRDSYKTEKPWALPLLNDFFIAISNPQVLDVLQQVLPTADVTDPEQMKLIRSLLLLLPPEAILALGPLLPQIHSYRMQRQLTEIIATLAKRDLRPLEELLDRPEESMVRSLIYILGHLKGERPTQVLLKMTNHPSEQIRKQTLKILMEREPQLLHKVFSLIDDPSVSVRDIMLEWLGQRRDEKAEGLLRDYLEKRRFQRPDRQHLLPCYKALGRCGSSRSIPFLKAVLLNRAWIPGSRRSIHRQGAAAALRELGTAEAKEILRKASGSPFPSVRSAYRKAIRNNR